MTDHKAPKEHNRPVTVLFIVMFVVLLIAVGAAFILAVWPAR